MKQTQPPLNACATHHTMVGVYTAFRGILVARWRERQVTL